MAFMGPNITDQASGVFFGAFALFACTTASIMSGAVIECIQTVGFNILAIVLGSFAWVVAAAWGWHADGSLVTLSALAFNILMGIAGGIVDAWTCTKDPFWMMSGALAGIISVASGLDIYFPGLAFIIAFAAGVIL